MTSDAVEINHLLSSVSCSIEENSALSALLLHWKYLTVHHLFYLCCYIQHVILYKQKFFHSWDPLEVATYIV